MRSARLPSRRPVQKGDRVPQQGGDRADQDDREELDPPLVEQIARAHQGDLLGHRQAGPCAEQDQERTPIPELAEELGDLRGGFGEEKHVLRS